MRTRLSLLAVLILSAAAMLLAGDAATKPAWSMNATIIEACSCPMFCQCYFTTKPAAHHVGHETKHFCNFNNAFKVNRGMYGKTDLAGAKFWVAGNLGEDFSSGQTDWAVLTFDASVTPEQREGIMTALGKLYPVKWDSFALGKDAAMEWKATKDAATALLDGGKTAEVQLARMPGNTDDPVVIKNLRYFGAPRNDGFVLMPNTVEAYRIGPKAYEYKGTNGFMITVDVASTD